MLFSERSDLSLTRFYFPQSRRFYAAVKASQVPATEALFSDETRLLLYALYQVRVPQGARKFLIPYTTPSRVHSAAREAESV